jgi:phage virion morphogenesis protein
MITVTVDNRSVLEALESLSGNALNVIPALRDIGEHLTETTKRRFDTGTAPDGSKWPANSEATILGYLGSYKGGSYTKAGKLSAKGIGRVSSKRPLIGETRSLMSTINPQLRGNDALEIGSPLIYSAMQQFGGRKSEFSNLWGDIPARPFLGLSEEDERSILDIVAGYMGF